MREAFFLRKVAIVTGGTRGLGICVARELLDRGASVAVCARDPDEVSTADRDLVDRSKRDRVLSRVVDVTDEAALASFIEEVDRTFGKIDMLFNVAGVIVSGPYQDHRPNDIRDIMETNFFAPMNAMDLVIPYMRRRGRGNIVNIASLGGVVAVPHLSGYTASKFALNGFSQSARAELRREGIKVSVVNPGLMRTGSPVNATVKGRSKEEYGWFALMDSLPLLTISAKSAARSICDACKRGRPHTVLSLPAKLAGFVHAMVPNTFIRAMTLANDLVLPKPTLDRSRYARGSESSSVITPSPLTAGSDRAAEKNNEIVAQRPYAELPRL